MDEKQPRKRRPGAGKLGETPYEKVDTWFDIAALEHSVLELWESTGAFERLREKNRGQKRFSFIDGPITANNPMGVHHAWGRTYKDVYQRYWAMNGYDQRYQNGFDCQGLWVEVEVEKEHGFSSKRQIEQFGIDRFVEECKARVIKYSGVQTRQSIRLGMWMDWENSYYTMSDENNYTIWAFLKKCHEGGYIYRGTDVVPWSGRSGSSYSQMEVIEGRKLVAHAALFLVFPLRERQGESLLVWTTTPWTLTSNVAAAVNVDMDYVRVRMKRDQQVYYLAAENLEFQRLESQYREKKEWVEGVPKLKTIAQILNEHGGYTIEGYVKGADLVGLTYDGPFDELEAQSLPGGFPAINKSVTASAREAHRVIDGGRDSKGNPVVVAGEGTGIVHIAPGCGDIDHEMGLALGLPAIAPLDEEANFLEPFGFLAGRNAIDSETVDLILRDLDEKGLLIATESYPHYYPHCWRNGDELVFRLVDEWYIRMDWRDEIKQVANDIRWIPDWGRDRELEWLTNMRDWMISKKRYWGLALPIWSCEECEDFCVIGGYEELRERAIEGWEEFDGHSPHRPWIDGVEIACPACGGKAHRIPDVGNPWLDAGIVAYSTTGYDTDRDEWAKWVPADFILECFPGQYRNWFYSLIAMSTMMESIAPTRVIVGHALVRDEEGREMHKSKGNAIWFDDVAEEVGADVMRWLFVRQDPLINLNFGYHVLHDMRGKFINTLWNTYGFLANYARIAGYVPAAKATPFGERPDFDRWIITELEKTIDECRAGLEDYNVRASALAIESFVEKLSNWYIRNNRRRFWTSLDDRDCLMAFETLYECVQVLTRLCAPMIPFITEAIFQNMVYSVSDDAPVSVHLTEYPVSDPARMDIALADEMGAIMRLISLALSARESGRVKVRQPLSSLTIGPGNPLEQRAAHRFEGMLRESLNIKEVKMLDPGVKSPIIHEVKPNLKTLGPRLGKKLAVARDVLASEGERLLGEMGEKGEGAALTLDGESYRIDKEDLMIEARSPEGQAVAEDGNTWVSLDTVLTEELKLEGLMRELLRRMQVMRKDIGLDYEDRIDLAWDSESEYIARVFEAFHDYLAEELLVLSMERREGLSKGTVIAIGQESIRVIMEKAGPERSPA